jgi:hypothetical protein
VHIKLNQSLSIENNINQTCSIMNLRKTVTCTFLWILLGCSISTAQQWGLYTLYATKNGTQAYLVDTNGTTYKTWTFASSAKNAYSTYMKVPGDTLVRTYKPSGNTSWNSGGCHGGVQKVTWNGTVVWDYQYYSSTYCLHHDICPLPNGNVLMICYETKTAAEATQAGSSSASAFWSEKIIEVHPTGATTGTIVWEWHLWDHLCQNYNSSKDHYVSSIVNNPQMLNINYAGSGNLPDRYHMNGIDYNAALDQIVVSMHFMNGVFVIDHSTTTAQAADHTGGNCGKGGDFLYRWGNPAQYSATGTTIFSTIHDAHWVPSNNPLYPNYLCGYNNQGGTGGKTAITIWNPPYSGNSYSLTVGSAYAPSTYAYQFTSTFTATNEGNSQQLPNGNMLVNNPMGAVYEVNSSGTQLWTKASTSSTHAYRFSICEVRGPIATADGATTVCPGSSATLSSSATSVTETSPSYTYSWTSSPAGFTSTLQNPVVNPTANTTYTVVITNPAIGCSSSANVAVNVYALPAVPVISQISNYLSSSSATSYQWYLNGGILSGSTAQTYTPTQSGNYTVVITDANGCTATSASYNFTYTGVEDADQTEPVKMIPNPTTGQIRLSGSIIDDGEFTVDVFNSFGKLVASYKGESTIDLSSCSNGLYFLMIRDQQNHSCTGKIILHK